MIKYSLRCDEAHTFDGWFASSSAFEEQQTRGLIECPHCGSIDVEKALMAPSVTGTKKSTDVEIIPPTMQTPAAPVPNTAVQAAPMPQPSALLTPEAQAQMKKVVEAVREFRSHVEKTADNVGDKFAEEALKIHYGEAEERGIYGEAKHEEVKELLEEGVDILPLPVLPEEQN